MLYSLKRMVGSLWLLSSFLVVLTQPARLHKHENISVSNIGDVCSTDGDCSVIAGSYCNLVTSTCHCPSKHPLHLNSRCIAARPVNSPCIYTEECAYHDNNSYCLEVSPNNSYCKCKVGYLLASHLCVFYTRPLGSSPVPAVTSLAIGLVILLLLLVFIVKLFSNERWAPARGFADAGMPPTIVIDGKDLSECSRVFCAGDPLSEEQIRKMSILSSVTLPLHKDIAVRSVSPSNSEEYQRLFGSSESTDYEQHITIISNRPAARRASMADHAFPELHSKPRRKKSDNLLILTRTRTDTLGRRHSVAVPLIPPQGYDLQADILSQAASPRVLGRRSSSKHRNNSQSSQLSQSPDTLQIPKFTSVRQSSRFRRRSSRQEILHFLDLAIAK